MIRKSIICLLLLYSMYFIGHFTMSMAYQLGQTVTGVCGIISSAAALFTWWKAAGRSRGRRKIAYGIVSGFFLWCFFGEFLEHEEIIAIARLGALPLLASYLLLASLIISRRYLTIGTRFALGHFGCVWLLHFILVNQAEVLQVKDPELFQITSAATGIFFLLTALVLLCKLLKDQNESSFAAYLLLFFVFSWATVETVQMMHLVPDYTCYAYWSQKLSAQRQSSTPVNFPDRNGIDPPSIAHLECLTPPPRRPVEAMGAVEQWKKVMKGLPPPPDSFKQQLASFKERYAWEDNAVRDHACSLLERVPLPLSPDDFAGKLDTAMRKEKKKTVDRVLFSTVMAESFMAPTLDTFRELLTHYVQEFKERKVLGRDDCTASTLRKDPVHHPGWVKEKILWVREYYTWESEATRELASCLLEKFSFLLITADLLSRLDITLKEKKRKTVDESLFLQALEETFAVTARNTFDTLISSDVDSNYK